MNDGSEVPADDAQKFVEDFFEDPLVPLLTRIADALDRAYPPPAEKAPGKLKPGVAEYKYEDPQTEELRRLRDGPKETPSH